MQSLCFPPQHLVVVLSLSCRSDRSCTPHNSCLGRPCLSLQFCWEKILAKEAILHFLNELEIRGRCTTRPSSWRVSSREPISRARADFAGITKIRDYSPSNSFVVTFGQKIPSVCLSPLFRIERTAPWKAELLLIAKFPIRIVILT